MHQERILMRSPSESAELQRADYQRQKEKLLLQEEMEGLAAGRKKCFKCKRIKPLDDFYRHPQMADGRLGKCKSCNKKDVKERYNSPDGRKKSLEYEYWRTQTQHRKAKKIEYEKRRKERHPGKAKCNSIIGNAIKCGRIVRQPCSVCGDPKSEAHHDDYRKPLEVRWLCFKHHREFHGQIVGITA